MYKETLSFSSNNLVTYLNTISFLELTKEKSKTLDDAITEKELLIALPSMENNKSPGNDGLTEESYITFWNELKAPLLLGIEKPSCKISQYITKTSSNKITWKKGCNKKVYSKLATYFLTQCRCKINFESLSRASWKCLNWNNIS